MTAPPRRFKPYPAYKDSGVDWLGEIPGHWEVKPLKALSQLQTGLTLGKKYQDGGLITRPYLRVANVQDGELISRTLPTSSFQRRTHPATSCAQAMS